MPSLFYNKKMIQLYPDRANLVILSSKENTTISNPTFLMRFEHKESKENYTCIIAPIDDYEFYRQSFEVVTVDSSADNLNGEVVLVYGDEYNYYLYAQSSTTNLDYTLANELVEQGIMKYNKDITERNKYERGNTTRKVYTR